jgi:hypothetical protein
MEPLRWSYPSALARLTLTVGAVALLSSAECWADLVGPTFDQSRPEIFALGDTGDSVTYSAASGDFNVQALGLYFITSPFTSNVVAPLSNGLAVLDLKVGPSGNLAGPGSLTVTGAIDLDQDGSNDVLGTLLTGTINAFGAAAASASPWEFDGLLNINGGALTQRSIALSGGGTFTDLLRIGDPGAFDLTVETQLTGILGDFVSDFSGSKLKGPIPGVAQAVPEPSTSVLAIFALASIAGGHLLKRRAGGCLFQPKATRRHP